jgi:hypothetical protein
MAIRHRALIIGAGRIGAGFNWNDDAYTHAGAYRALSDRVELVGFVEPDLERRVKANLKWGVPSYDNVQIALEALKPNIVSVCVQPEQQKDVFEFLENGIKGVWCEKPFMGGGFFPYPIQVNYMRRGDKEHRFIASVKEMASRLIVYGKDDIHTRCHFEDLAKWWNVLLDYRPFNGPCAYIVTGAGHRFFDNGGVDGGTCFKAMLRNLLDHVDNGTPLWSPAR